eukprot:1329103-Amphidinium_carterae.1
MLIQGHHANVQHLTRCGESNGLSQLGWLGARVFVSAPRKKGKAGCTWLLHCGVIQALRVQ